MPELPEVETIVRDLRPVLVGQEFVDLRSSVASAVVAEEVLFVYGRGGKPCLECGEVLVKTRVAGRGDGLLWGVSEGVILGW